MTAIWFANLVALAGCAPADDAQSCRPARVAEVTPLAGEPSWHVMIGDAHVDHLELARRLADREGRPLPPEVLHAFAPPRPRNTVLASIGWIAGGVMAAYGAVATPVGFVGTFDHLFSPGKEAYEALAITGIAIGATGLASVIATAIYTGITDVPADPDAYFSRAEAERLVTAYNRTLP